MKYWEEKFETMDLEEKREFQGAKLRETVQWVYEKIPFYKRKLDEKGVSPGDIRTIDDIRHLPFPARSFSLVMAPYGILQSLLRERDLAATLEAVHRVLARGGVFGLELVADLPAWEEYKKRVSLKGWRGRQRRAHVSLVESVRQDRRRRLTVFTQRYLERRGRATITHAFDLTFRTLTMSQMARRLARAGFVVENLVGDYRGRPWTDGSDVWIILAKKG